MKEPLSIAYRPKTLDALVGQEDLVKEIRGLHSEGRRPKATMLIGETGSGKTTIARILAVANQCRHQEVYGNPCKSCYRKYGQFDIKEINAGDVTGIDVLREQVSTSDLLPGPGSRVREFIIDEAQGLSKNAQTLLLKYLEDCPRSTLYYICTTEPQKILPTIQSRCVMYVVKSLKLKGVRKLVRRALHFAGSELASDQLVDALNEQGITSPRMVVQAVEKYVAGAKPEDAARVRADTEVDTYRVCRAVIKGDWEAVSGILREAKPADASAIQRSLAAYLNAILLDENRVSARATIVAKAISQLTILASREDGLQLAGLSAILYRLCKECFTNYKR